MKQHTKLHAKSKSKVHVIKGVVFNDQNQVLILLNFPGAKRALDLPGGKREGNEKPQQTACRETKEETGLDVIPILPDAIHYEVEEREDRKLIVVTYLGKVKGNADVTLGGGPDGEPEHKDKSWMGEKQFHNIEILLEKKSNNPKKWQPDAQYRKLLANIGSPRSIDNTEWLNCWDNEKSAELLEIIYRAFEKINEVNQSKEEQAIEKRQRRLIPRQRSSDSEVEFKWPSRFHSTRRKSQKGTLSTKGEIPNQRARGE